MRTRAQFAPAPNFLSSTRAEGRGEASKILPGPQQNKAAAIEIYWNSIAGDIAHEIGHAPGGNIFDSDHAEGGLMSDGFIWPYSRVAGQTGQINDPYSPATILRFRKASFWKP